jgi:hypothetical protein
VSRASAKEVKEIIRAARRQEWRVKTTKRGHVQFFAPDGESIVTSSGTPSDPRALANLIAQLRKYEFDWKGR